MKIELAFVCALVAAAPRGCAAKDDPSSSAPSAVDAATPVSSRTPEPVVHDTAGAHPAASAPLPAVPASAPGSTKSAGEDTKAYCKKMYARAYALCRRDDRDCKFLAADKWDRCEKTGRWP